jgi:hypothetical protein
MPGSTKLVQQAAASRLTLIGALGFPAVGRDALEPGQITLQYCDQAPLTRWSVWWP